MLRISYNIAFVALVIALLGSLPAEARDIKLRSGSFLCPDYGWFEHATDDQRTRACTRLSCEQNVAIMALSANYAYVCNQVRNTGATSQREIPLYVCAYATIKDMVDSDGKYQTAQTLSLEAGRIPLDRVPAQDLCP